MSRYFANGTGDYAEGNLLGRAGFDADGCRLLDTIWPADGDESQAVTQSLRCYSPADLRLRLEGTGLTLQSYEPYAGQNHDTVVSLREASHYLAKLIPDTFGLSEKRID